MEVSIVDGGRGVGEDGELDVQPTWVIYAGGLNHALCGPCWLRVNKAQRPGLTVVRVEAVVPHSTTLKTSLLGRSSGGCPGHFAASGFTQLSIFRPGAMQIWVWLRL